MTATDKKITLIHQSTVKTLSPTERFFVDFFVKIGSYRIIPDEKVTV